MMLLKDYLMEYEAVNEIEIKYPYKIKRLNFSKKGLMPIAERI